MSEQYFQIVAGSLRLSKLRSDGYLLSSDDGGSAVIVNEWDDLVEFAAKIIKETETHAKTK